MASSDRAAKASAINETSWPMDSFGKARTISGGGKRERADLESACSAHAHESSEVPICEVEGRRSCE